MQSQPSPPSNPPAWTLLQRRLHWAVALLVAVQFLLQVPMKRAVEVLEAGGEVGAGGFLATTLHTWGGASVALLVLWRLKLRRERRLAGDGDAPRRADGGWRGAVAFANHVALYAALLFMATSGALFWYAGLAPAKEWHGFGKWALGAFVGLHVAAALWHALVRRDDVLRQMTAPRGPADRIGGIDDWQTDGGDDDE